MNETEGEIQYCYDPVLADPTTADVLDNLRQSFVFRSYWAVSKLLKIKGRCVISLSAKEVGMLLGPSIVDWDEFHTSIVTSISNPRATNQHNCAIW